MTIGYKASKQSASKRLSTQLSTWTAVDAGGGTLPTGGSTYTRPSDWLALPDVGTTQQFIGLYAVFTQQNLLAFRVNGNYTVDWGDGVIENFTANTVASHSYNYATISASTLSSRGYKQVIIKITPQAGYNITELNFQRFYTGQVTAGMPYNWLEMVAYTPYLNSLLVGTTTRDDASDFNNIIPLLEIVDFKSTAITDATNAFKNCRALQLVKSFAANLQYAQYMFQYTAIKSIPLLNLANCSDTRWMFANSKLETVPDFNLANVQRSSGMFFSSNITTVPNLTLTNCYNAQYMFADCYNLRSVGSITMKGGIYVPAQSGMVRYTDYMFQNTPALTTIGTLDITSNTTMLIMGSAFNNCGMVKLPEIVSIDSNSRSVYQYDFGGCYNLADVSSITLGISTYIIFRNAKLSAASLNTIYGLLNTSGISKTIDVSNCFGAAGSTKSIATNRGWTVIG